ncbi:hypothetical protein TREVI0001_1203 [Treponema vincentii ATCC 35580]|uniref:Uncharacterized protein n=1 Tax=Treponema vincentii ATCC 35580 TaxID=596324 RepID=C8PS39_9SPIR|nr:hypothetical protein TREVI0001_1203 [Treponema vincentii ATCC 35580]
MPEEVFKGVAAKAVDKQLISTTQNREIRIKSIRFSRKRR